MTSVKLKINNYREAVKNKKVIEIIDKIISSYPVTFVNLERLRKEADELDELFWIKDDEGKYLLVNNKFAVSLHLIPSQVEGKPADKFVPSYLINFNNALDQYIKETRSTFTIEGYPLIVLPAGEEYQILEIPVPGSEGNVSAIIGVIQNIKRDEPDNSFKPVLSVIKSLARNFILVDKENNVEEISDEFSCLFALKVEQAKGKSFEEVLPPLIKNVVENFIGSGNNTEIVKLKIPEITNKDFKIFLFSQDGEKLIIVETENVDQSESEISEKNYFHEFIVLTNPEPAFIYDKENLKFLLVNDAALKLYGYRKDEFLLLDLTDLYTPEDSQTLLETSEEKSKEGVYSKPYRQKRKDGANIFVTISRNNIIYKDKESYINVTKDVTKDLELKKESQYFKSIFNASDNLIFITDKEGFIKSVNNSVIEALGYSGKSLIETSFTSLVRDEDRGKINSALFKSDGKEKIYLNTFLKKPGNEFLEVSLTANPIIDFNGEIETFNIICINEKVKEIIKEIVKEVPVEVERKEIVNEAIPGMNVLSAVFHDLLTPINVILGFVQEIWGNIEEPTSEQNEAIEIINQNRDHLLNKMDQIMEFIQLENQNVELKYDTVKITDVIEELRKNILKEKNGELAYGKISSSLEAVTDAQKFRRFLTLLISICIKNTDEKKVYVSTIPIEEDKFAVILKDNYNISSEKFIKNMSSFFSNNCSLADLGTSIFSYKLCKTLLSMLGGEFKLIREKEKADISFIFPINLQIDKNDLTEVEEIVKDEIKEPKVETIKEGIEMNEENLSEETNKKNIAEPSAEPVSIDLSQMTCLYIEDQLDSQRLFSSQMHNLKAIDFAVSLEQAVPLLKFKNFDFIVVDINLQGDYNGVDILKIIRTMPDYENIPVIAVTAYLMPSDRETFIQAGFNDFISKPISGERLIESLEKILLTQA